MGSEPLAALDQALGAIAPYGRPDLEARLRQARYRLLADRVRVLVVGEFKQGKSLLVNGLVSAPVCPVFDDVATPCPPWSATPRSRPPRWSACSRSPTTATRTGRSRARRAADRGARPARRRGRQPGQPGGLAPGRGRRCRARCSPAGWSSSTPRASAGSAPCTARPRWPTLPTADAVLLVSDAVAGVHRAGAGVPRGRRSRLCPNVACVLTKTDLYPEWRRIAELDRGAPRARPASTPTLFAVSSTLRWHAHAAPDDEASDAESGFPELVDYLPRAGRGAGRRAGPALDRARRARGDRAARRPRCAPSGPRSRNPEQAAARDPRADRGEGARRPR